MTKHSRLFRKIRRKLIQSGRNQGAHPNVSVLNRAINHTIRKNGGARRFGANLLGIRMYSYPTDFLAGKPLFRFFQETESYHQITYRPTWES